jgi:hypothetical protein
MKNAQMNGSKKIQPVALNTNPEEVVWASMMFAVVISVLAFVVTYGV